MADGDASLLALVIVIAALVTRTAVTELRHPGSARLQWAFTTSPGAMAAGATVAAVTIVISGDRDGWAAAAWALLAGTLAAFVTGSTSLAVPPPSLQDKESPMPEGKIGKVLAAVGAPLTPAGVAMYFLPGPGVPVLVIGLSLLIVGMSGCLLARLARLRTLNSGAR